jgi:hypothetical protein
MTEPTLLYKPVACCAVSYFVFLFRYIYNTDGQSVDCSELRVHVLLRLC